MEVPDKLASLLAGVDDAPYFPFDSYDDRTLRFALRAVLLVALCLAAHWSFAIDLGSRIVGGKSAHANWIWTDHPLIQENIHLRSRTTASAFWLHPLTSEFSPLGGTTLFLEYSLFGGAFPGKYQFVTLLAHSGSVVLFWFILRRLGVRGAWLSAAIFAVHPIEVQSLTWTIQQPNVLGTLCLLASVWSFLSLEQIHPPAPAEFVLAPPRPLPLTNAFYASFLLALLYWPALCMAGPVFPLLLWWKKGRISSQDWGRLLPMLALCCLLILAGLVFSEYRHAGGPATALGLIDRLLVSSRAIWFYLLNIVVPVPRLFVQARWQLAGSQWTAVLFVALAELLWLLWWQRRRIGAGPAVALTTFALLIAPHLPLVRSEWMATSFVGDWLQYAAGLPLIALLGCSVATLIDRTPRELINRLSRIAIGLLLVGGLGALAVWDTLDYSDEVLLWQHAIDVQPLSLIPRARLSECYFRQKQYRLANQFPYQVQAEMDRLQQLGGADAAGIIPAQLAQAQLMQHAGSYAQAIDLYDTITKLDPRNHQASLQIGLAYLGEGQLAQAIEALRQASDKFPTDDNILDQLGFTLFLAGRVDDGIEKFIQAIKLNPHNASAHVHLSDAYFLQGVMFDPRNAKVGGHRSDADFSRRKFQQSAEELQIVNEIDPRNFAAFLAAGHDLIYRGDFVTAQRMLEAAVQVDPTSPDANFGLGLAREMTKQYNAAIDSYATALKLRPGFKEAAEHLEHCRQLRDLNP